MAVQGLRNTDDFVADQRPKNFREAILHLWPNGTAPLTALRAVMRKESTDDPEFAWWRKDFPSQRVVIAGSGFDNVITTVVINTATSETEGGATQLKKDMILLIEESDELMRITADPATDFTVLVERGFAGTTAAAVDPTVAGTNPNILVLGNAMQENSLSPTPISYNPTKVRNYTQIFRDTLGLGGTAQNTRTRTGDQLKEQKRETLELHSVGMERALWFGERSEVIAAGEVRRTTRGIVKWIEDFDGGAGTNVFDSTATPVDMEEIEEKLELFFRYGSTEKMCFCGSRFALSIQQAIRKNSTYQFMLGQKEFGMNVMRLVSPFGELVLKTHPLFTHLTTASVGGTVYNAMIENGVILDMDAIRWRFLRARDTNYKQNLQENDRDGIKEGYLTEGGMELPRANVHFYWKGVRAAAADD